LSSSKVYVHLYVYEKVTTWIPGVRVLTPNMILLPKRRDSLIVSFLDEQRRIFLLRCRLFIRKKYCLSMKLRKIQRRFKYHVELRIAIVYKAFLGFRVSLT